MFCNHNHGILCWEKALIQCNSFKFIYVTVIVQTYVLHQIHYQPLQDINKNFEFEKEVGITIKHKETSS